MTPHDLTRAARAQRQAEGYLELEMPEHALDVLGRVGDPDRLDPHGQYLLGEALRMTKRYCEALVPLESAVKADPDDLHAYFALGWCYKRTGQLDRAIAALEQALEKSPREALVHYNLACYLSLAGKKRDALSSLSRAFDLDPDYRSLVDGEADFDPLRRDPNFQALCGQEGAVD